MIWRIKNWDAIFENAKSRMINNKSWGSVPNKQDGLGYARLLQEENGEALYGAFISIVLVCSKQARPREGYLTDNGKIDGVPYDAAALSLKTRFSERTIAKMLEVCSSQHIGWLEVVDCEDTAGIPQGYREGTARVPRVPLGGKEGRKEGKNNVACAPLVETESENNLVELKKRLSALMRRRSETTWSDKEIKTLREFEKKNTWYASDFDALAELYADSRYQFQRRDMSTLLNNLHGELDRARQYKENPKKFLRL